MENEVEKILRQFPDDFECLKSFKQYLFLQIMMLEVFLKEREEKYKTSRLSDLDPVIYGIVTAGKAILNLVSGGFITEGYMIARSFLEKSVNFCYLIVCEEVEYKNYIDYSKQRILRSLYAKQKAYKCIGKDIPLPNIFSLSETCEEVKKFTGRRGGEKNWTEVSLYERIKVIEDKIKIFNGAIYLAAWNYIYEDASESLHGTLYGEMYHTGLFYGIPNKEEGFKYAMGLGSNLYMLLGLLVDGLFQALSSIININCFLEESKENSKKTIGVYYKKKALHVDS